MIDTSAYVHFPWCLKKCPYCDFATRKIDHADLRHAEYADAVLRELDRRGPVFADRRLVSVFFGGGTPSLWAPRELGRVLSGIRAAFPDEHADVEVTVECNPSSLDERRAHALREVGVDRVSVGVQSLSDERLRFLGRFHDAAGAVAAIRAARVAFERVSADLMFGMPGQTWPELREEVSRVLDLGVSHLSSYALTIEPGTQFGELHRKGRLQLAPDDDYAEMYLGAREMLAGRGLEHYEVSNWAMLGERSRHNLHYWRGGDYLGLGAAAVGMLRTEAGRARRWRNEPVAEAYLDAGEPEVWHEDLDADALVREALMLGLRTLEGTEVAAVHARAGVDPLAGRQRALRRRMDAGDVVLSGGWLRVPTDRWLVLDGIVADLF